MRGGKPTGAIRQKFGVAAAARAAPLKILPMRHVSCCRTRRSPPARAAGAKFP
jgi:hypothetical protein